MQKSKINNITNAPDLLKWIKKIFKIKNEFKKPIKIWPQNTSFFIKN